MFFVDESKGSIVLFHYSQEQHPTLKTLRQIGYSNPEREERFNQSVKTRHLVGHYLDHISFFIDPIPRNLPEMSKNKHTLWKRGVQMYEHQVILDGTDFVFDIVATPEHLELMEAESSDIDWSNQESISDYFLKERKISIKNGYCGSGTDELKRGLLKFQGKTEHYFKQMFKRKLTSELRQYAARVPHVMIYSKTGNLPVFSSTRIKLK
jgi:hypothetical protein